MEPVTQAQSSKTPMSGGRLVLVIVGGIVAILALFALVGGGSLLALNHTERDSSGFFSTGSESFATDAHAIVSDELDIGTDGPDWLFEEGRLATLRVRGSSAGGEEIFIGIGPTDRIQEYLGGTSYDRVRDLELDPFSVSYDRSPGTAAPSEPAGETFWDVSAEGAGTQSVEWEVAEGNWSVVVMNADASPGVDARLSLGAKVGFLFWVGLGLLIGGAVFLAAGAAMIYFGLRRGGSGAATRPAPAAP